MNQATAKIFKGKEPTAEHQGTAWLFAPEYALTAAHCIGNRRTRSVITKPISLHFPWGVVAATIFECDFDLDVAVLFLSKPASREISYFNLATIPTDKSVELPIPWSAYGFPQAMVNGMTLSGKIVSLNDPVEGAVGYQLTVDQGGFNHLNLASGAAVCHQGKAVGVIRWAPPRLKQKVILATPVSLIAEKFSIVAQSLVQPDLKRKSLLKLQDLSQISEEDAAYIADDESLGGKVFLDQGLYVVRNVEKALLHKLDSEHSIGKTILIVGEAGRGKTSLLWSLYRTLKKKHRWVAWFLKSTMLTSSSVTNALALDSEIGTDTVLEEVDRVRAMGKHPLLLIDTLDLLLHDESSRNFLVNFLARLKEQGCTVVATCRPQEVIRINSNSRLIDYERIVLTDYQDERELEEAIRKHAARLYALSTQSEEQDSVTEILSAVARGLPVREVCANPLTLRMLFLVYAPSKIASDVNVYKLYKYFWEQRVESDYRAGSPFVARNSSNLSKAACAVALIMLAEGIPDLPAGKLKQSLHRFGLKDDEIERLISRDVLRRSNERVSFFHQTFFEHSAARGLMFFHEYDALRILKERFKSKSNDLFTGPVYEQALLLAEDAFAPVSNEANRSLIELITNKWPVPLRSGIYIYCHRQGIPQSVSLAMQDVLKTTQEDTLIKFLELAINITGLRVSGLFVELSIIWESSTDRVREHVISLLERLVPRNHTAVIGFIEQFDLLTYVFNLGQPYNTTKILLGVIKALSFQDPSWGWKHLIEFCQVSTKHTRGRDSVIDIMRFIAANANEFGKDGVATKFEAETANIEFDDGRDFSELVIAYGNLWCLEWQAQRRLISDILTDIAAMEKGTQLAAKANGLGQYLVTVSESKAAYALSQFEKEERHYHRALWRDAILPTWLRALDSPETRKRAAVKCLSRYIRKNIVKNDDGNTIPTILIGVIYEARLTSASFACLFGRKTLIDPRSWLDEQYLIHLLADGFIADHPGAKNAMQLLTNSAHEMEPIINRIVGPRLAKRIVDSEKAANVFFEIVLKLENVALLSEALKSIPSPIPPTCANWCKPLVKLCENIIELNSNPQKRRHALIIWKHLIDWGKYPSYSLSKLTNLIKTEADPSSRGHVIELIGRLTGRLKYDLHKVFEVIEPFAISQDADLKRRGIKALAKALAESEEDIGPFLHTVCQLALNVPPAAERLSALQPIIEKLLHSGNVVQAVRLFKEITLGAANSPHIGVNGKQKIRGRLKQTARKVVRYASRDEKMELLSLIPTLDRVLGVMITDAICYEALGEFSEKLDLLLQSNDIPGEIKSEIIKYKYTQERSLGGKEWPELYRLIVRGHDIVDG